MEIFTLDSFSNSQQGISKELSEKIEKEITHLQEAARQGQNSMQAYLKMQNGKKLQGTKRNARHIFKYRLSGGERLFYTYGRYLDYVSEEWKGALFLISYSTHDRQGQQKKIPGQQGYRKLENCFGHGEAFEEEDLKFLGIKDTGSQEEIENYINRICLNYQEYHKSFIASEEELLAEEKKGEVIKLSPEQGSLVDNFLENPEPTLILGGAGTGKTLVSLHLLNDYSSLQGNVRRAYFTQSEELLNKARNEYERISGSLDGENLGFFDINEYCIGLLDALGKPVNRVKFVKTQNFLKFFRGNQELQRISKKLKLSEMDIWTEIRGVIKGSMTGDWKRVASLVQDNYDGHVLRELEECGFIQRRRNKKFFRLSENGGQCSQGELSVEAARVYRSIEAYYQSVDNSVEEMEEEEYLQLPEEQTMVEREKRAEVYRIYLGYKKWMRQQGYFDENDLIRQTREAMKQAGTHEKEQFQFMVVDEVQDYTEFQIYFLYELVEDKNYLVYAGDRNQIINPTLFEEKKLKMLHHQRLNIVYLKQNFRCQKSVVALGNALSEMRRKRIGLKQNEKEERSEKSGVPVMRLKYSEGNLRDILTELLKYPGVAVLVPDKVAKEQLIDFIGREVYEMANNKIVRYISESKGMEYTYVLCVNMLGNFSSYWRKIVETNEARKNTRFRYYFNLFYVAITRAKDYLCLMEQGEENAFFGELQKYAQKPLAFDEISCFDAGKMYLSGLSNDAVDWLMSAEENFLNGIYDVALDHYKKANAGIEKIARCKGALAAQENDFAEALKQFLVADYEDGLTRYQKETGKNTELKYLVKLYLEPKKSVGQKWFAAWDVEQSIEMLFGAEERETVRNIVLQKLEQIAAWEMENWTLEEVAETWQR